MWVTSDITSTSNSTDGDASVAEDNLKKSNTEIWQDKDPFFSFRILSQQIVILVVHYQYQTPWCQLHWVQTTQSTSKSSWSSPYIQDEVPQLSHFQGDFASQFQRDVPVWDSIMIVRKIENTLSAVRMNSHAFLNTLELEANGVSAELCNSRLRKSGNESKYFSIRGHEQVKSVTAPFSTDNTPVSGR